MGVAARSGCSIDLFYGVDYNSHLGTRRAGMATFDHHNNCFCRSIHTLEQTYFRTKFEKELPKFKGDLGIGVISDTDPQPIVINSHLGKFAIVTVAHIENIDELERELIETGVHFGELSSGKTNQPELVALLINQGRTFREGINLLFDRIKGSCTLLILTEKEVIGARDRLGRTPLILGHKDGAYCLVSETTAFANLGYQHVRDLGPGEIVAITPESALTIATPGDKMQVCSFLWVNY